MNYELKTQPDNWPSNAPAYHSAEGWAFEKQMAYERMKKELEERRSKK